MLFHENPQLVFFVVSQNIRLKDEAVLGPD